MGILSQVLMLKNSSHLLKDCTHGKSATMALPDAIERYQNAVSNTNVSTSQQPLSEIVSRRDLTIWSCGCRHHGNGQS